MTRDELVALLDRIWFGPYFTFAVVDEKTVKTVVDVRTFWPGGPRNLTATTTVTPEMDAGAVVSMVMGGAASALIHELQEQVTIDGKKWMSPHEKPIVTLGQSAGAAAPKKETKSNV